MEYRRRIAGITEVEEVHNIIEQGTTMPVRCRLKNGMNAVVKYMRNPVGQQALVNEWIGSSVADVLGLTIPEYGICNLSKEVIENTNYNEDIDYRNAGYAFYTKEYSVTIPITISGMLSAVKNHETEKIILFDHLVNNKDRHSGNLLCDISKEPTLLTIDSSHIVTEEPKVSFVHEQAMQDSYILSNGIILTNKDIYERLCTQVGYSEKEIRCCAVQIKELFTDSVWTEIRKSIPDEWKNSVGDKRIEQMFEVLSKRTSLIGEIAELIIEERRKL